MKYGIYDTVDNCWLGENEAGDGPKTFDDVKLAVVAARIANVRLGYDPKRIMAAEFADEALVLKDTVKPKMSTEEALKRLEDGRTL